MNLPSIYLQEQTVKITVETRAEDEGNYTLLCLRIFQLRSLILTFSYYVVGTVSYRERYIGFQGDVSPDNSPLSSQAKRSI